MKGLYRMTLRAVCAALLLLIALPVSAQAQMEKIRVAYTVIAPTQLNVWTA